MLTERPMLRISRVPSGFGAISRLKLGDRVIVEPENRVGTVIAVSYGEITYDIQCGNECLRHLRPRQIRRAAPVLSVVEASLWQWNLWGEMPRLPNGLVKVPANHFS